MLNSLTIAKSKDTLYIPLFRGVAGNVKRGAPVRKVAKHDSKIDRATENADTKATNTTGCSFCEISWGHDGSLPDS